MESLVSPSLHTLAGKRVLVTGHTGFKGSWLVLALNRLGAQVSGLALPPPTSPALFDVAHIRQHLVAHHEGDVRDAALVASAMEQTQPDVVFHLAAQALVRRSYRDPLETWGSNVMGTAHVLEAVRRCPSVRAVVVVTTDKCYENQEWVWGYRESDPLGGHDPYAASKAAAELVAASYRQSFLQEQGVLVATARAGNVIGGGDWAEDRLIPDIARAVAAGKLLVVRNPAATRPWQHVLDAVHGYLLLAAGLLEGRTDLADAFNFGPPVTDNRTVREVLDALSAHWPEFVWKVAEEEQTVHEARFLYLDASRARHNLGWNPRWTLDTALAYTADWYRTVLASPMGADSAQQLCLQQLEMHVS